jgi:hypothetical protein
MTSFVAVQCGIGFREMLAKGGPPAGLIAVPVFDAVVPF